MPNEKNTTDLPVVDLPGIEVFAEGSWNGDKYTGDDLQAMVDAFPVVGFEPTVKAGHADGQDSLNEKEYRKVFGAPALGYVKRIYRKGPKLLADLKQVPRHFANLIKAGSYKRVSSEVYWNYNDEASGKKFPRVLKSVAFLGAEIPALPNLKAIEALFHKNDAGLVYAYDRGHEYRVYEMTSRNYHGEGHDQEDHGNWADGSAGDADSKVKTFKDKLNFPYVDVSKGDLGSDDVYIKVSMDDKSKWSHGIFQNSRYAQFVLRQNGTLEMIAGHGVGKLRKGKVKSVDAAVEKINAMKQYDLRAEAFEYAMDEMDGVYEKEGKWCAYKDGKQIGEYASKDEAMKALGKTENYQNPQEERQMTEAEVKAQIDAAIAAVTKDYEAKTAEAVAAAVIKAKAEAAAEKAQSDERIAQLEKQAEDAREAARNATIDSRVEKLSQDGKISGPEAALLKGIMRALPNTATHAYQQGENEVKEPVVDTIVKLFEARKSLFSELGRQTHEIKTYSDAQAEVVKRAEALQAKDANLSLLKAYQMVAKDDPELWGKYQLDVRGSH